jgi:hypothetical protein
MYMYVMLRLTSKGKMKGERVMNDWKERERERRGVYLFLSLCFLLLIREGLNLIENGRWLHTSSAASAQNIQHESRQTRSNCLAEERYIYNQTISLS